jgi:eukaryotic-like serine/threonine-protein kinase
MRFEKLGPYRLDKKLGQGGMGAVYQGVDESTGKTAAVKVLSPQLASDDGFRIRFQAEIESLKKLRHPNIVRLYAYGEQEGSLYYAMELVRGSSLEDELRAGRRFNWREVTDLSIKLCRALKHAHDSGVIHRDIKPANLLLSEDGQIKLSDFGIARLFGNTRLTSDGGVLGTAEYMAPEQADGRMVTDRCDQYSLGGVMYALLAGRPPFRGATLLEMLQLQRYAEPESVRRYAPDTPAELDQIIRQLLEKDPQRRFANALILGRSLESMQRGLSLAGSATQEDFIVAGQPDPSPSVAIDPLAATLAPSNSGRVVPSPRPAAMTDPVYTRTAVHSEVPRSVGNTAREPVSETSADRFINVEEQTEEQPWYQDAWHTLTSWQTLLLVAALTAIVGLAVYVLKPSSADDLYAQIENTIDADNPKSFSETRGELADFLKRFPDDPRAAVVQGYSDQADELRAQRELQLKNRLLNRPTTAAQSPIERAYREALFYKIPDPELALGRFQALLDLFGREPGADQNEWIGLTRTEVTMLSGQLAADHAKDLAAIEAQLTAAQQATDLEAARKTWQAIITLYGEKAWAAESVTRARAALAGTTPPSTNGR